jgi:hypothetical protein
MFTTQEEANVFPATSRSATRADRAMRRFDYVVVGAGSAACVIARRLLKAPTPWFSCLKQAAQTNGSRVSCSDSPIKTISSSYKTAQRDDLKIVIREGGDPRTPAMLLLHGLKKLMNTITIMTKVGTQICGSTQFWKDLSVPFYGHTRIWWPGYLPPTFVSRRFSAAPLQVVSHAVKVAGGHIQLEFDI